MRVVIPGGTGQVGAALAKRYLARGDDVVVLSRSGTSEARVITWDGKTLGPWAAAIDGADVVINLAGRTVNCRYSEENLRQMLDSRVDSTRVVGEAIAAAKSPPRVWLQMSTATIYAHRFDAANDEPTGVIGGHEPDVPAHWARSVHIATSWERALHDARVPGTRKVALRTAMVMGAGKDGIFDVLHGLVRKGLGGSVGGGRQYVSWIHERDFLNAVDFLVEHDLEGAVNLAAPAPLPYADFMRAMREAEGTRVGLPATRWMAEVGAFFLRTDTELILKSRRVVSRRLPQAGFTFAFQTWPEAARDLTAQLHARS